MEIVEGEERYLNLGATVQGRVLLVVTTWRGRPARVVTAFETHQTAHSVLLQEREGDPLMAKKQPPFKTEAQEAEWWRKIRSLSQTAFEQAKAARQTRHWKRGASRPRAGQPSRSFANDHNPLR